MLATLDVGGEGVEDGGWHEPVGAVDGVEGGGHGGAVGGSGDDTGAGVGAAGAVLVGVEVGDGVDAQGVQAGGPIVLVGVAAVGDDVADLVAVGGHPGEGVEDRPSGTGGGGDDGDPLGQAGGVGAVGARRPDADDCVEFVAEVGLGAAGLVGLDAPCGVGVGGAVLALPAFGPRPGAGPVDGVAAGVGDPGGHGGGQHQVEDLLQGRRPVVKFFGSQAGRSRGRRVELGLDCRQQAAHLVQADDRTGPGIDDSEVTLRGRGETVGQQ